MSPQLKRVEKAGIRAIKKKRIPSKISIDDFFKDTETNKLLFSQLINSSNPNCIATVPSVSYGMATVANNLPRQSGNILIADGQFPSNVYPWMNLERHGYKVKIINKREGKSGSDWNEEILSAIDNDTVMLAIGHVHWADGTKFRLDEMRTRLNDVNGLLIIDGTQSIGALPFDQSVIQADAIICAAYKWLMGPYGIGLAYYGERFHEGRPIEENWINRKNSNNFSELVKYQDEYREGAQRFSVGEQSNFVLVPMLKEALKQVLKWTPEKIQLYTNALFEGPNLDEIQELGFTVEDSDQRASHLFGIGIPEGLSVERLQQSLKARKVNVSFRGDSVRISPHVYNDETDIRRLITALKEAKG